MRSIVVPVVLAVSALGCGDGGGGDVDLSQDLPPAVAPLDCSRLDADRVADLIASDVGDTIDLGGRCAWEAETTIGDQPEVLVVLSTRDRTFADQIDLYDAGASATPTRVGYSDTLVVYGLEDHPDVPDGTIVDAFRPMEGDERILMGTMAWRGSQTPPVEDLIERMARVMAAY